MVNDPIEIYGDETRALDFISSLVDKSVYSEFEDYYCLCVVCWENCDGEPKAQIVLPNDEQQMDEGDNLRNDFQVTSSSKVCQAVSQLSFIPALLYGCCVPQYYVVLTLFCVVFRKRGKYL